MRFLALLAAFCAVIPLTDAVDPCKRQPFRGRCPSKNGDSPKRSQFVLRYYMRNGECVSYPYGHCSNDDSEPLLYRYKEECEDACINPPLANLGTVKEEDVQTYGTVGPIESTRENEKDDDKVLLPSIDSTTEVINTAFEETIGDHSTIFATSITPTTNEIAQSTETISSSEVQSTINTSDAQSMSSEPTVISTEVTAETSTAPSTTTTSTTSTTTTSTSTSSISPSSPSTTSGISTANTEKTTTNDKIAADKFATVQPGITTKSTTKGSTTTPRTECERRRLQSSMSTIRGGFVPVCTPLGSFEKVQCEPDGRQCFCVDSKGIEVANSRTRNGQKPDCDKIQSASTPTTKECVGNADRGPCSGTLNRWYYDEKEAECKRFVFSGCGGNGNNYETKEACTQRCAPPPMGLPKCEKGEPLKTKLGVAVNCAKSDCPSGYKCSIVQQTSVCCPENNKIIGLQTSATSDVCLMSKDRGPCDKYELRFYFNAELKECKYFFWGGCQGNGNNFEKVEDCESTCGISKVKGNMATTIQPSTPGNRPVFKTTQGIRITPGMRSKAEGRTTSEGSTSVVTSYNTAATIPFRSMSMMPSSFESTVDFNPLATGATQMVHVALTRAPPIPEMTLLEGIEDNSADGVNRCLHPKDPGNCRGQFVRWYWDNENKICDVFTYTGCQGNGNNYGSREECMAICHKEAAPVVVQEQNSSSVCKHDVDAGECNGIFQRFAFDTESGECRPFTYGGCGGNGNNFATLAECRIKCQKVALSPGNLCDHDIEVGECSGVFVRFGYDKNTNDCRQFTYGGCGGNGNNFATIQECRNVCIKKLCNPNPQCDLTRCQIVNDRNGCPFCSCPPTNQPSPPGLSTPQCPEIDTEKCEDPCMIINNRKGCKDCVCPASFNTEGHPPGSSDHDAVLPKLRSTLHSSSGEVTHLMQGVVRPPSMPAKVGPPSGPTIKRVQPPGSNERARQESVRTMQSTQTKQIEIDSKQLMPPPLTAQLQEKCMQPVEPGPCKHFVDRWYFNSIDGTCHPFKYGGCAGNRNHFFTQNECEIHCARFLHRMNVPSSPLHVHKGLDPRPFPDQIWEHHQQHPQIDAVKPSWLLEAHLPKNPTSSTSHAVGEQLITIQTPRTRSPAIHPFDLPANVIAHVSPNYSLESLNHPLSPVSTNFPETYEFLGDINNLRRIDKLKKASPTFMNAIEHKGRPELEVATTPKAFASKILTSTKYVSVKEVHETFPNKPELKDNFLQPSSNTERTQLEQKLKLNKTSSIPFGEPKNYNQTQIDLREHPLNSLEMKDRKNATTEYSSKNHLPRTHSAAIYPHSYGMESIEKYNPQRNNNLVGLSPPVDPTYFTYNSQHLGGGKSRQFAVNSIPFDETEPITVSNLPRTHIESRASTHIFLSEQSSEQQRKDKPNWYELPITSSASKDTRNNRFEDASQTLVVIAQKQEFSKVHPVSTIDVPRKNTDRNQQDYNKQLTHINQPLTTTRSSTIIWNTPVTKAIFPTVPFTTSKPNAREGFDLSNAHNEKTSYQLTNNPSQSRMLVNQNDTEQLTVKGGASSSQNYLRKTSQASSIEYGQQQSEDRSKNNEEEERNRKENRVNANIFGNMKFQNEYVSNQSLKPSYNERSPQSSRREFPRRIIEDNLLKVSMPLKISSPIELEIIGANTEREKTNNTVKNAEEITQQPKTSVLKSKDELSKSFESVDGRKPINKKSEHYVPIVSGIRVLQPSLNYTAKHQQSSVPEPPTEILREFERHSQEFRRRAFLVKAAQSDFEVNILNRSTYLKKEGSVDNAPSVRVPDKQSSKMQELSEHITDNEYPQFLRAPPNSTRTQAKHTLKQTHLNYRIPYDNFSSHMQFFNTTVTVPQRTRPNLPSTRLNIQPIDSFTGIASDTDDDVEEEEITNEERNNHKTPLSAGETKLHMDGSLQFNSNRTPAPPTRSTVPGHIVHGKKTVKVSPIPIDTMTSTTNVESSEDVEVLTNNKRASTITGQRVSRTTLIPQHIAVELVTTTTSTVATTTTANDFTTTTTAFPYTSFLVTTATDSLAHSTESTTTDYTDDLQINMQSTASVEEPSSVLESVQGSHYKEDSTQLDNSILSTANPSLNGKIETDISQQPTIATVESRASPVFPTFTTPSSTIFTIESHSDLDKSSTLSTLSPSSINTDSTVSSTTMESSSTTISAIPSNDIATSDEKQMEEKEILEISEYQSTTDTIDVTTASAISEATVLPKKVDASSEKTLEFALNVDDESTKASKSDIKNSDELKKSRISENDSTSLSPPAQNEHHEIITAHTDTLKPLKKIEILPKTYKVKPSTIGNIATTTTESTSTSTQSIAASTILNDIRLEEPSSTSTEMSSSADTVNYSVGREPVPLKPMGIGRHMMKLDIDGLEEPTTVIPLVLNKTRQAVTLTAKTTIRTTPTASTTSSPVSSTTTTASTTTTQQSSTTSRPTTTSVPTTSRTLPVESKAKSIDARIVCALPPDPGVCFDYVPRWFFNSQSGQCEQFSYGSCGGNENNFMERTACESKCMHAQQPLFSHISEQCAYASDGGFGGEYHVKWYFNVKNLRCEQFVYAGRGGNSNQFDTIAECERTCSPNPAAEFVKTMLVATQPPHTTVSPPHMLRPLPDEQPVHVSSQIVEDDRSQDYDNELYDTSTVTSSVTVLSNSIDSRVVLDPIIAPSSPVNSNAPGHEPHPPAAQAAKTVIQSDEARELPVISANSPETKKNIYKADPIPAKPDPTGNEGFPLVGPSPPMSVNYQTGEVRNRVNGIRTFQESSGRVTVEDSDLTEDEEVQRRNLLSCPNGLQEMRYSDGRPVMCLPGKNQCPEKSVCYFNGLDFFCCPNEEDPYDKHVFGGYDGEETKHGYKVFGPLNIRRLMDEVPLRTRRMANPRRSRREAASNTVLRSAPEAFNLDSIVAPLRFDDEKPRQVSRAQRMRSKPSPPNHGNPICVEPLSQGDCDSAHLRYYYDRETDTCRLFYYSGCKGNNNNFGSLNDCQKLCVLGGQRPRPQYQLTTSSSTSVPRGYCPDGTAPLGGSTPVLCGNSTDSIACPVGFYCLNGPPDVCCPYNKLEETADDKKSIRFAPKLADVPQAPSRKAHLSTPKYMCPDASDPIMSSNGEPAPCGSGFDGLKLCPRGFYCAIDVERQSRMCCPLYGAAERVPNDQSVANYLGRRTSKSENVDFRSHQDHDNAEETLDVKALERIADDDRIAIHSQQQGLEATTSIINEESGEIDDTEENESEEDGSMAHLMIKPADVPEINELTSSPIIESNDEGTIEMATEAPSVDDTKEVKDVNDKSVCQIKPSEGRTCREDEKAPRTNLHYFYSPKDRRCKLYFYRGCGGNANRFEKKSDCERLCMT